MGDPLAAGALVMAVLAMLYGAWSPEINQAATLSLRDFRADRVAFDRPIIVRALRTKAWPLCLGTFAAVAIFAWRVKGIIETLWDHSAGAEFDDVGAAFVVTEVVTLVLFVTLAGQVLALRAKLRACRKAD